MKKYNEAISKDAGYTPAKLARVLESLEKDEFVDHVNWTTGEVVGVKSNGQNISFTVVFESDEKDMDNLKQNIIDALIDYAANSISSDELAKISQKDEDQVIVLLRSFQKEYDAVEIDAEGATAKQEAELDAVLDDYAGQLMAIN